MNSITHRIAAASLAGLAMLAQPSVDAAPPPACITPSTWTTLERAPSHPVAAADIMADMAKRDAVLLGEYHDEDDHHRWQVQTLSALYLLRPDMVIGFEMFPRRVQAALDRWVAGELTVKQFLEQTEWNKVWNTAPELYLPLFQFARINRIPMIALNVDSELNKAIRAKGWDAVPESQREGVGRPASPPAAYRDFLFEVYRQHASGHGAKATKGGKASKSDNDFRYFVESQTTWDRAMAEALARPLLSTQAGSKPLIVGIMGSAHIRFGYGVTHQLGDLGIKNVGTLLALPHDADCKEVRPGLANAVFALPPQAMEKPEPPRLGVRLDENEGVVRIAEVTVGSLAEKTGLKAGDRLLEMAGVAVTAASQAVASVRRQPGGSWLPIQVKRGEETLDLLVKFPVSR
jgi:uncharacterized iron-regulated protein